MPDLIKTIRSSFLELSERSFQTPDGFLDGDFLLTVSNAEPRCLEILQADFGKFIFATVVRFASDIEVERRNANHLAHTNKLSTVCTTLVDFERVSITNFYGVFAELRRVISLAAEALGRPITLSVDASCLPKHYLLFIVGYCFANTLIKEIRLFYAEADYSYEAKPSDGSVDGAKTYRVSVGEWTPIVIPYLEGDLVLESRSRIIALLGFEALQARSFIRSYQADQYAAVLASSSSRQRYADLVAKDGVALAHDLDIPENNIYKVEPSSAVEVASLLSSELRSQPMLQDTIICLGTKPHAIGAAFHAIASESATLVCRVPTAYVASSTVPNGRSWLFTIRDQSALESRNIPRSN